MTGVRFRTWTNLGCLANGDRVSFNAPALGQMSCVVTDVTLRQMRRYESKRSGLVDNEILRKTAAFLALSVVFALSVTEANAHAALKTANPAPNSAGAVAERRWNLIQSISDLRISDRTVDRHHSRDRR